MAMPPIADHREQACLGQLREMGARGLRRDARRQGQLTRGQGPAIEERRHHRRPRRFSDQRRDLGDHGTGDHVHYLTPKSVAPSRGFASSSRGHPTWLRSKLERLDELLGREPAQAKAEIAKHLHGELTVRPLPSTGSERRAEIRGRAKLNSLLEGQEAVCAEVFAGAGFAECYTAGDVLDSHCWATIVARSRVHSRPTVPPVSGPKQHAVAGL